MSNKMYKVIQNTTHTYNTKDMYNYGQLVKNLKTKPKALYMYVYFFSVFIRDMLCRGLREKKEALKNKNLLIAF